MKKLFAFYVLLAAINVWSQSPYQEFQFVNIKEGISKVGVTTIVQDHYGFIWIGTSSTGLYKFDGIQYTSYTHKLRDSTSLSSSRVLCSFLDSRNRLWIGTENGLNLYDENLNQFKRITIDQSNNNNGYIIAIEEDSSNNLVVFN